jgi:hypothetical protein
VSLKSTDRLFVAVRAMLQNHTSSVAVFDDTKKSFLGFVDILDVATMIFLLAVTDSIKSVLSDNEPTWEQFTQKEVKVLAKQTLGELTNISERDPWRDVSFQATAVQVLENLIPKAARRVTVRDAGNAGIEGIISQWDAVRWLQVSEIFQRDCCILIEF